MTRLGSGKRDLTEHFYNFDSNARIVVAVQFD